MSVPVAIISSFINNTPVVAMFIPVVNDWCKKIGISPSKLFIPLSYVAILGGMCTLIGTSTNLVVHALMVNARKTDPAMPLMTMFTITPVGGACAVAGILFIVTASRWLLPSGLLSAKRSPMRGSTPLRCASSQRSIVDGLTIEAAGLRHLPGAYLSAIERDGDTLVAVGAEQVLRGDDRLMFVGVVDSVVDLQRIRGLLPATDQVSKLTAATIRPPAGRSRGERNQSARRQDDSRWAFPEPYDAAVIAVYRNGERLAGKIGDIVLRAGDTLLLQSAAGFASRHRNNRDFLLVSAVDESRPVRHDQALTAAGIVLAMVLVAGLESRTSRQRFPRGAAGGRRHGR